MTCCASRRGRPDCWTDDPGELLARLLAARDHGTGAYPVLLAHTAHRAGDTALAENLFIEESWREFGPAMTWRLTKLSKATERPAEAAEAYRRFLTLWNRAGRGSRSRTLPYLRCH